MRCHATLAILMFWLTQSLCLAAGRGAGSADDSLAQKGTARLRIVTDIDSALVSMGGQIVGKTPFVAESLSAGSYEVKIIHPDIANWVTPTISDTIRLRSGEDLSLKYSLTGGVVVQSVPDGASVVVRDSLLGVTPLVLPPGQWSRGGIVQVLKPGYEPVFVDLILAKRGVLMVPLHLQAGSSTEGDESPLVGTRWNGERIARLYISAGVLLVSGIASASFKIAADARQEGYAATGDPYLLAESRRLDTLAGISLAVLQVNIGLFLYFLLSD